MSNLIWIYTVYVFILVFQAERIKEKAHCKAKKNKSKEKTERDIRIHKLQSEKDRNACRKDVHAAISGDLKKNPK